MRVSHPGTPSARRPRLRSWQALAVDYFAWPSTRVHDAVVDAAVEKERWRRYGPELCLLLWATWDPIPGDVPLDEYDNYAPPVWTLLARGASEEEIASHLRDVRERMMEVGGAEQDARAASKIWEWWHWRFEEDA